MVKHRKNILPCAYIVYEALSGRTIITQKIMLHQLSKSQLITLNI